MAAPLRIALLGCGALAEILAEQVYPSVIDSVKVVAAIDIAPERAKAVGGTLGAPGFSTLREAVAAVEIDGVDVRLPHQLHVQGAEWSAELALPFLIEKPMASSLAEAKGIAALAQGVSGVCGVSENYGFLEPVLAARTLLRSGAIGELLLVKSIRVFELGPHWRRDGWRVTSGPAEGVLIDQATHAIRMFRTVVGEIAEVHAYASSHREGFSSEDTAVVSCRFASGHIGVQLLCWACPDPAATRIPELSLYGTAGSITVYTGYEGDGGTLLRRPGAADEWHVRGTNYFDSLGRTLEDWADAVRAGREPACSIREGLADMAVMEAIQASRDQNAPIPVPQVGARR
jgi:predicted dehydrogenase